MKTLPSNRSRLCGKYLSKATNTNVALRLCSRLCGSSLIYDVCVCVCVWGNMTRGTSCVDAADNLPRACTYEPMTATQHSCCCRHLSAVCTHNGYEKSSFRVRETRQRCVQRPLKCVHRSPHEQTQNIRFNDAKHLPNILPLIRFGYRLESSSPLPATR